MQLAQKLKVSNKWVCGSRENRGALENLLERRGDPPEAQRGAQIQSNTNAPITQTLRIGDLPYPQLQALPGAAPATQDPRSLLPAPSRAEWWGLE